MPRVPRNLIVEEGFQTHKIWRGHNKEWNISSDDEKEAYLNSLNNELEIKSQTNEINAFGLMSNHTHEVYDIKDIIKFSNMMRNHHSRYGMFFNRKHDRQGKVAYDRPRTCLIEDDEHAMTATFYIHANPIRAGITKNASNYRWSTHKLYAFGKREKFMKNVRFPRWYMALGNSWEQRQRKYRRLFDAYLREVGLIKQSFLNHYFYGDQSWISAHYERISEWRDDRSSKDPP